MVYATDAWYTFPVVAGAVQVPMVAGGMRQIIIVGISRELSLDRDTSRFRDYTPTTPENWKKQAGEAEVSHHFLSKDVFNYIESTYSTDIHQRTYVGVSLGAMLGAYILFSAQFFKTGGQTTFSAGNRKDYTPSYSEYAVRCAAE